MTVTVRVANNGSFANNTIVNTVVANATLDDTPLPPVTDDERTPLTPRIGIQGWTTDCVNDAPFVNYDIEAFGVANPTEATITLYRKGTKTVIDEFVVTDFSGRFIYPGAAVDADGNGTDWPGWKFENGTWVLDDSDAYLRDGIDIVVSVNPTAETAVSYPPADSACADPTQTEADLAIVKTASVLTIGTDDTAGFNWELVITNKGPDPAVNVVVGDLVPDTPLDVKSVTSADFDCTADGDDVTCTRGTLAAGASGTVTIAVVLASGATAGTVENVATVQSDVPDPRLDDNSSMASVDIVQSSPPVTQAPPPVTLPRTGSNAPATAIRYATMFLAAGAAMLLLVRRRRINEA